LLADQGEALGRVPVEIDDTTGAEAGLHHAVSSLGIKRNVKAFHTLSVSWEVMLPDTVCPLFGGYKNK
jgi:hypothetical protein